MSMRLRLHLQSWAFSLLMWRRKVFWLLSTLVLAFAFVPVLVSSQSSTCSRTSSLFSTSNGLLALWDFSSTDGGTPAAIKDVIGTIQGTDLYIADNTKSEIVNGHLRTVGSPVRTVRDLSALFAKSYQKNQNSPGFTIEMIVRNDATTSGTPTTTILHLGTRYSSAKSCSDVLLRIGQTINGIVEIQYTEKDNSGCDLNEEYITAFPPNAPPPPKNLKNNNPYTTAATSHIVVSMSFASNPFLLFTTSVMMKMYVNGGSITGNQQIHSFRNGYAFPPSVWGGTQTTNQPPILLSLAQQAPAIGTTPDPAYSWTGEYYAVAFYDHAMTDMEVSDRWKAIQPLLPVAVVSVIDWYPSGSGSRLSDVMVASSTDGGQLVQVVAADSYAWTTPMSVDIGPYPCIVKNQTKTTIVCTTTPGTGTGLTISVRSSNLCASTVRSPDGSLLSVRFSYPPPRLVDGSLRICPTASPQTCQKDTNSTKSRHVNAETNAGGLIGFECINCGPSPGRVVVRLIDTLLGESSSLSCPVQATYSSSAAGFIVCSAPPGFGRAYYILVTVDSQRTNIQTGPRLIYEYPLVPVVDSVYTSDPACIRVHDPVSGVWSLRDCPTSAASAVPGSVPGSPIVLNITGSTFNSPCSVTIGGNNCEAVVVPNAKLIQCNLPVGTSGDGIGADVVVTCSGGKFSAPKSLVSYAGPTIAETIGCDPTCNRAGGDHITIKGANFGSSSATVLIGGTVCQNVTHDPVTPHQQLTCILPPGSADRSVLVIQDRGQMSVGVSIEYEPCAPGFYGGTLATNYTCLPCPPGQFSREVGAPSCSPCVPGEYNNQTGQSACVPCPVNTYSDVPGSSYCLSCPGLKFTVEPGARACAACPGESYIPEQQLQIATNTTNNNNNNTYSDTIMPPASTTPTPTSGSPLSPVPVPVPDPDPADVFNTSSSDIGNSTSSSGRARDGNGDGNGNGNRFNRTVENGNGNGNTNGTINPNPNPSSSVSRCTPCPNQDGVFCRDGRIYNKPNWWLYTDPSTGLVTPYPCPIVGSCVGSASTADPVEPRCGANRKPFAQNVLCGTCVEGNYEWGGECSPCGGDAASSRTAGIVFSFLILAWLYVLLFHKVSQSTNGLIRIFLFFVQTSVVLMGHDNAVLEFLSVFNFNILDSSGSLCIAAVNPLTKLWLGLLMPIVSLTMLFLTWIIHALIWKFKLQVEDPAAKLHKSPYMRTAVGLIMFSYNSVTDTVFRYFKCQYVGSHNVMSFMPSVSCDSSTYTQYLPLAYIVLIVYVIGAPVGMLTFLLWNRGKLLESDKFDSRWGILYEAYHKRCAHWFEFFAISRRTILIAVTILYNPYSRSTRYSSLGMLLLCFLCIHIYTQPFSHPYENLFETATLTLLTFIAVLLVQPSPPFSATVLVCLTLLVLIPIIVLASLISFNLVNRIRGRDTAWSRKHTNKRLSRSSKAGTGTGAGTGNTAHSRDASMCVDHSNIQMSETQTSPIHLSMSARDRPNRGTAPSLVSLNTTQSRRPPGVPLTPRLFGMGNSQRVLSSPTGENSATGTGTGEELPPISPSQYSSVHGPVPRSGIRDVYQGEGEGTPVGHGGGGGAGGISLPSVRSSSRHQLHQHPQHHPHAHPNSPDDDEGCEFVLSANPIHNLDNEADIRRITELGQRTSSHYSDTTYQHVQ